MASIRPVVFRNGFYYHVFNRGVERRPIFLSTRDRERFVSLLDYYRFDHVPKSYSHYNSLPISDRTSFRQSLDKTPTAIEVLTYCLMPNHFHLLVKQNIEHGIRRYLSNVANGYAKYFNMKRHRVGPLFQGPFKAVMVETDEQLIHLCRYIHINPVTSGIISTADLVSYPWSSYSAYLGKTGSTFINTLPVLGQFRTQNAYHAFIFDQIDYAKELEKIKHLLLEDV